jgi:hypothetical protein
MKIGDKLKAKVDLHAFLNKGNYYYIAGASDSSVSITTNEKNEKIFFSLNTKYQTNIIPNAYPNIIQVHMYLWDYFDKTLYERKSKLEKINSI